jgi:hypothetical protein
MCNLPYQTSRTPLERSPLSPLEMSLFLGVVPRELRVMTVLSMSRAEIDRVHALKDLLAADTNA